MNEFKWARTGGYEVSSKGNKNFSAFHARLKDGRTIEEAYQLDIKGYRKFGNDPMLGKGKPPLIEITKEELYEKYKDLWRQWAKENPSRMEDLRMFAKVCNYTLSDMFASTLINQARALSELLNEETEKKNLAANIARRIFSNNTTV